MTERDTELMLGSIAEFKAEQRAQARARAQRAAAARPAPITPLERKPVRSETPRLTSALHMRCAILVNYVEIVYCLPVGALHSYDQTVNTVEARQVAQYLFHTVLKMSIPDIARSFHRDRSTVKHAIEKMRNVIPQSPALRHRVATASEAYALRVEEGAA